MIASFAESGADAAGRGAVALDEVELDKDGLDRLKGKTPV
jgi:hypothetical protein